MPSLMHPRTDLYVLIQQQRNHHERTIEAIHHRHIAGLKGVQQLTQQGRFSSLLAGIRPDGEIHRAGGCQGQNRNGSSDGKPDAWFLSFCLRVLELILLGIGFFVMSWGSGYLEEGGTVGMRWLIATYFLHTVGELCLSPVGLSSTTKLAPKRLVGQMMGTWFMGAALGNLIAGLVAGYIEAMPLAELFGTVATIVGVTGVLFLVLARPIGKLAVGIK